MAGIDPKNPSSQNTNGTSEETQRVNFNWKYHWHHLTISDTLSGWNSVGH